MRKSVRAALTFLMITFLAGCSTTPVGKPLVTYERDSAKVAGLSPVEKQGLYALFPGNGVTPLDAAYLFRGDSFGFKNVAGKVMGVYSRAGQIKSVPLDGVLTTEYVWKYEGDKQP